MVLFLTFLFWATGFRLCRRFTPDRGTGAPRLNASELSIIIPARNEAHNLPTLLRSLSSQPVAPAEILVVDDGSADGTAALARSLGAGVLPSAPLPEGWRGKTWACHQGAKAAQGRWLLFLDADTWFYPGGLEVALARYPGGAYSLAPFHGVKRPYEDLSLFFNLNMIAGTVPGGLFGQMLLVEREGYGRAGGHEAVRGRILENLALAGRFRDAQVPVRSAVGWGALSFRMYPGGLRELAQGWIKGFASGAGRTPAATLVLMVVWQTGLLLAAVGLLANPGWIAGLAYACCAAQVGWLARKAGAFRWLSAVLYPAPLFFFFGLFFWSAVKSGRQVTWKGRTIRAD